MAAKTAREKVALAKQKIAFQWRFLTPKMFDLKFLEKEGVGTACTDGVHVWWDPRYIDTLSTPETMFVVVHEIFHPTRKHHLRIIGMKDVNRHVANIAMDATINNMIVDEMDLPLPKGCVYMPQYRGWTWEAIYKDLMKNAIDIPIWDEVIDYPGRGDSDEKKDGDGKSNGKGKDPVPGADGKADQGEIRAEDKRIEGQLKEMERIGKKAGKMPGSFSELVKSMTETKVPWQHVLARFIDDISDKDYDWMVPDENYINGDIYIPTLHDPKLIGGVVGFDTSASVDGNKDFPKFKGGLFGILSAYNTEVHVLEVDYIVQKVYKISTDDLNSLKVEFKGRGGTSFEALFNGIKENNIEPKFLVYFTDGEANDFPPEPDYPVLWALLDRGWKFTPPFGEVLYID